MTHRPVQRGELDLDAPVARYRPEFAAAGKADVSVRRLLNHPAGVAAPDEPVPLENALAWTSMVEALAAQTPNWLPGSAFADPERRIAFAYVTDHIAEGALGLLARNLAEAVNDVRQPTGSR
ncbi:serine hydrolase domain-containing protein [Nocardia abscessus]|uniref:serine hydrolase domain-containing protein n=1 Tax=Nocardia abscessus TaxID=120957 RepID=UPI00245850D2|nr:serine hydrolase domain-containing protein [Nocardia abscessus]